MNSAPIMDALLLSKVNSSVPVIPQGYFSTNHTTAFCGQRSKVAFEVVKNEPKPMCPLSSKFGLFSISCADFLGMPWEMKELAKYLC